MTALADQVTAAQADATATHRETLLVRYRKLLAKPDRSPADVAALAKAAGELGFDGGAVGTHEAALAEAARLAGEVDAWSESEHLANLDKLNAEHKRLQELALETASAMTHIRGKMGAALQAKHFHGDREQKLGALREKFAEIFPT
jgi:hypothetical protein